MEPTRRAFRSQISKQILDTLAASAVEYSENGEAGTDLRDAPEYLLCVDLARGLTSAFGTLRYHLEHRASSFEATAENVVDTSTAMGKALARFDVVLLDRKSQRPRYVIEVKRGTRIVGDARRLMRLAALEHGRPRWKHGFIVTIMRRTEERIASVVENLKGSVLALNSDPEMGFPVGSSIAVQAEYRVVGQSNPAHPGTSVYAAVLRLSLTTSATSDPDEDALE